MRTSLRRKSATKPKLTNQQQLEESGSFRRVSSFLHQLIKFERLLHQTLSGHHPDHIVEVFSELINFGRTLSHTWLVFLSCRVIPTQGGGHSCQSRASSSSASLKSSVKHRNKRACLGLSKGPPFLQCEVFQVVGHSLSGALCFNNTLWCGIKPS